MFTDIVPIDALDFVDTENYKDRLIEAIQKTGRDDAIATGTCQIERKDIALGVLDFSFMGGSMGSVVGERLTCLIELAIEQQASCSSLSPLQAALGCKNRSSL